MNNRILFFVLLFLLSFQIKAQVSGTIQGKIATVDNKPIAHVSVLISSLQLTTSTKSDGSFIFQDIPAGVYQLLITHVGFNPVSEEVEVKNGLNVIPAISLIENTNTLNEIVVSGSVLSKSAKAGKSEIKTIDLPQSVAVISQKTLENQQVNSVTDVLKNTNGVYISGTTGGYQEEISARGFSLGSSNTFKNGVRYFNGMTNEMSGVERVEVLKGSAAILYGNVQAGGIINFVTKKPQFTFGGNVGAQYGSFNSVKPSFDVYGGFYNSKKAAYRFNGSFSSTESFRKFVNSETYYFNPSFVFNLGKQTTLLVEADYLNDDRTADFGAGIVNYEIVDLPRDRFLGVKWGYYRAEQIAATATLNHNFNANWNLTSLTSFRHYNTELFANSRPNTSGSVVAADGTWNRKIQRSENRDNYFMQEIDFKGFFKTGKIKHQLLLGVDTDLYKTISLSYKTQDYDVINIFTTGYDDFRNDIPTLERNTLTETPVNRLGIYAQDLIGLNKYLKVLAGVRYSYQDTRSTVRTYDDAFTPRFGLIVQPSGKHSFFASYANSFQTNTGTDVNGNALEPSMIDQFEIGVKNELLNNKLMANVTVYQITNSNLAQISLENGNTNSNIKELAGEIQSKGVEVDFAAKPFSGVTVMAGYSFNETKYTKSNTYVEGSLLRYNPKHTANLSANYEIQNGLLSGLNFGVIGSYFGDRYAGRSTRVTVENDSFKLIPLNDYFLVDATLAYTYKYFNIRAKVANILNELSYNVHDDNSLNPIAPQNYSLALQYKF